MSPLSHLLLPLIRHPFGSIEMTLKLSTLSILIGLGSSLSVPTLTALLIGSVPAERAGTASGVLNTCRQLGGGLSVAVFGALVAHRETFVQGMQLSLVIAAVLLLATAIASVRLKSTETHA